MAKKKAKAKPKSFPWDKAATKEFKKFTDYVSHCRDFAETIAKQKEHVAVTEEDVADAIQKYAALWAGQCSKLEVPPAPEPKAKPKKAPRASKPNPPPIDEETQKRIDELKKFIEEEEEAGETGFGDPKARIAHWQKEIEELKKPKSVSKNSA